MIFLKDVSDSSLHWKPVDAIKHWQETNELETKKVLILSVNEPKSLRANIINAGFTDIEAIMCLQLTIDFLKKDL